MGIVILVSISVFFAILIALLSDILKIEEDNRILELSKLLPGYNCGACGKSGCFNLAKDVIEKGEDFRMCKPLKKEKAEEIEKFLSENID